MPRLSNKDYLEYAHWLRDIWTSPYQKLFGVLSVNDQWDIHAYFQPNKDWTDEERLNHRLKISKEQPTLPAIASKHLLKLNQIYASALIYSKGDSGQFSAYLTQYIPASKPDKRGRRLHIFPVARPEPDLDKLAQALIDIAIQETQAKT